MTTEPQRLQYLEAMGITAWVGRYRLPNALETPRCEWALPDPAVSKPPAERLHALLESPARPAPRPEASAGPPPAKPKRGKARALLGGEPEPVVPPDPEPVRESASGEPLPPREALRFTLQVAALEGRWLLLLPGGTPLDTDAVLLLRNVLRAAGIALADAPMFQTFRWPMMEELPVEAPLEEAREGLRAFVEGRRRAGWQPERLLLFGRDEVLETVLGLVESRCSLLDLPAWQGPSLAALGGDAEAKRSLMPQLGEWHDAWFGVADE